MEGVDADWGRGGRYRTGVRADRSACETGDRRDNYINRLKINDVCRQYSE